MFIYLPSSDFPHACQLRQGKFIFKVVGEKVLIVVGQGGKIISCRLSLFFPLDYMSAFDFLRNNNFLNRGIQLILTSFLFKITMLGFAAAVPHQTTDKIQLWQKRSQVIVIRSYSIKNHHHPSRINLPPIRNIPNWRYS